MKMEEMKYEENADFTNLLVIYDEQELRGGKANVSFAY